MNAASARSEEPGRPAQLALADDLTPAPARGTGLGGPSDMTIGEVLAALQADFPELTISKIRYYERQGLLSPARSAAGYRKFSAPDVRRLHYVLTAARDQYLPLRVIRERLQAGEFGVAAEPAGAPAGEPGEQAAGPVAVPEQQGSGISPDLFDLEPSDLRLTRRELLAESGLDSAQLDELEAYGLIAARGSSTSYEAQSLAIAKIVAELTSYGLQARHLRPVKAAVDREVGLIEQVLTPMVRQQARDARQRPDRDARGRAEQHARGYAALSVRLHVALLESALREVLRKA